MAKIAGEYDTFMIKDYLIAARPDGRKALILRSHQGNAFAFEIPQEILTKLARDLAKLAAQPTPPTKPNT